MRMGSFGCKRVCLVAVLDVGRVREWRRAANKLLDAVISSKDGGLASEF